MDRPKHSLEELGSPTCLNCGTKMRWYRSELIKFVPMTSLHLFNCPTCSLCAESETVQEPVWVLADKLANSRLRFFAAAA
jgi:hypothetical protein